MARKMTVSEFRSRVRQIGKSLDKVVLPPMRKHQREARKRIVRHYKGHDVASKIWKWRTKKAGKRSGPVVKSRSARWSRSGQEYIGRIEVSGLAAKVEEGGRLKRHVFWGKASRTPGMRIRQDPTLKRELEREWTRTVRGVESNLAQYFRRLFS